MKKLGFGLMRLPLRDPNDAGSIDLEQVKCMVDAYLAQGFTYFDTAWMYCKHQSELAAKEALVMRYPREAYQLATKLHVGYVKCLEDRDRIFDEQRSKTGVSFFDYYLLHSVSHETYEAYQAYDCFAWLAEKKKLGLVRHIGFSFHDDAHFLEKVLTDHPEVEFVQLQINYLDWESAGIQSRLCYEAACRHGVPVIVMEPVKGGTLAKLPPAAEKLLRRMHPNWSIPSWAIRFAAGLENVMTVLSGMSSLEQLADNTSYMQSVEPLTDEEQACLKQVVKILNGSPAIACTGCAYCIEGCPRRIPIPTYFSLYNADLQEAPEKGFQPQVIYYENLSVDNGKASDCIGCAQCEQACPQHLPIIKHLKTVAEHFEA